jgi:hypothetical protein
LKIGGIKEGYNGEIILIKKAESKIEMEFEVMRNTIVLII